MFQNDVNLLRSFLSEESEGEGGDLGLLNDQASFVSDEPPVIPPVVTESSSTSLSTNPSSNPRAANPDGKSPLSPYNLFFQLERKRILRGERGQLRVTPQEIQRLSQDYMSRPKRKHRKSHGQISFLELSRTVGLRWRQLDVSTRRIFEAQAAADAKTYRADKKKNTQTKKKRRMKLLEKEQLQQIHPERGADKNEHTEKTTSSTTAASPSNAVHPNSVPSMLFQSISSTPSSGLAESAADLLGLVSTTSSAISPCSPGKSSVEDGTPTNEEGDINLQDLMTDISPDPLSSEVSHQLALLRTIQDQLKQAMETTNTHQRQFRHNRHHASLLTSAVSTPAPASSTGSSRTSTTPQARRGLGLPPKMFSPPQSDPFQSKQQVNGGPLLTHYHHDQPPMAPRLDNVNISTFPSFFPQME